MIEQIPYKHMGPLFQTLNLRNNIYKKIIDLSPINQLDTQEKQGLKYLQSLGIADKNNIYPFFTRNPYEADLKDIHPLNQIKTVVLDKIKGSNAEKNIFYSLGDEFIAYERRSQDGAFIEGHIGNTRRPTKDSNVLFFKQFNDDIHCIFDLGGHILENCFNQNELSKIFKISLKNFNDIFNNKASKLN